MTTLEARSRVGDLGLLLLRIGIGATVLQAGLLKFFDFSTTVGYMETGGWKWPNFAAFLVAGTETAGGLALMFGLLTPLAACAVLGAMLDAWAVNVSGAAFWSSPFNEPFLLAVGALTLLLIGAGKFSLDSWFFDRPTWPAPLTVGLTVVAFAAAIATWVLLNGTNPLHITAPAA